MNFKIIDLNKIINLKMKKEIKESFNQLNKATYRNCKSYLKKVAQSIEQYRYISYQ